MASLDLINVKKNFGPVQVLHDISIALQDGEFLVLVGPSGCGKSTLMNIIAGLEEPSGGLLRLQGRDITGVAPADRNISMVFQSYALYPNMSVAKNIEFPLEMRKVDKTQRRERVQAVAKLLQIEHLLDRKPRQLSGGQRQRVAIGRALAREPQLYLFDEPLSNLDAQLRVDMRTEIERLMKLPNQWLFSYAMNGWLTSASEPSLATNRIESASSTVLMGEQGDDKPELRTENIRAYFGSDDVLKSKENFAHFLFCDGHVALVKRSTFDPRFAQGTDNPISAETVSAGFSYVPFAGAVFE